MGDYGLLVSQKGYNVRDCADRFLAYSSAFEGLKVFLKTQVTISNYSIVTVTHNLGYLASFVVFKSDGSIFKDCRQYTDRMVINYDEDANNATLTVFIFLSNFDTVIGENISNGNTVSVSSNDRGIRVSKEGYDVKECTDDQLIFSSSFYTNIVHAKGSFRLVDNGSGAASAPGSVSHNLGYVPDFFMYKKNDADSFIKMWLSATDGNICDITNTTLTAGEVYDYSLSWYNIYQTFYYVIFKNRIS